MRAVGRDLDEVDREALAGVQGAVDREHAGPVRGRFGAAAVADDPAGAAQGRGDDDRGALGDRGGGGPVDAGDDRAARLLGDREPVDQPSRQLGAAGKAEVHQHRRRFAPAEPDAALLLPQRLHHRRQRRSRQRADDLPAGQRPDAPHRRRRPVGLVDQDQLVGEVLAPVAAQDRFGRGEDVGGDRRELVLRRRSRGRRPEQRGEHEQRQQQRAPGEEGSQGRGIIGRRGGRFRSSASPSASSQAVT